MSKLSSEHEAALKPATDALQKKRFWKEEYNQSVSSHLIEYRLRREPTSFNAFLSLFVKSNGQYDTSRIIWIGESGFIIASKEFFYRSHKIECKWFCLELDIASDVTLYAYSVANKRCMLCLERLVALPDAKFERIICITLTHNRRVSYPLTHDLFLKLLTTNDDGYLHSSLLTFSPDQSRALAVGGSGADLCFFDCAFRDRGTALMQGLASNPCTDSRPIHVTIEINFPFGKNQFIKLLQLPSLERLTLSHVSLDKQACRSLAAAELPYLDLTGFRLTLMDGGAALVDALNQGRGPKGLGLNTIKCFDSHSRSGSFFKALRGNLHLKCLDLEMLHFFHGAGAASFIRGLEGNRGLVHLGIEKGELDRGCWLALFRALSTHPCLRTLKLRKILTAGGCSQLEKTRFVQDMLSANSRIEKIDVGDMWMFDSNYWNAVVAPKIDNNFYPKRLQCICEIEEPSFRAAVIGMALVHARNKPQVIWMILSQNRDIFSTSFSRDVSAPSSKRNRSLSSLSSDESETGAKKREKTTPA